MRALVGCLSLPLLLSAVLPLKADCQEIGAAFGKQGRPPLQEYIEEFFLSDAVRNQDKGELQFSFGVDSRQKMGTTTSLKTEYGITRRLQLNAELPYGVTEEERSESTSRWSTASLGFQYQIIRSDFPFALSAGMAVGVPVSSTGEVEYQPMILAAKAFRRAQLHASFVADIEEEESAFQYNLGFVYAIQRHWFPTLEFNGRYLHDKNAFYLTPGLYRRFEHRFECGIGVPLGVSGGAGAVGIVGKLSWEIGRDHRLD
jgi:hypothetical protein